MQHSLSPMTAEYGAVMEPVCWSFDLTGNTDRFTQTYLDDLTGEFPRIDDRRAGLISSHGWYASADANLPTFGGLSGIVHVDGKGSRLGQYLLPVGDTISEPVFVARGDDVAEGDGWLLAAVWRVRENRSDLAVFNERLTGMICCFIGRLRMDQTGSPASAVVLRTSATR
jgi:carotenoid cleavage dioxygenase-like enzyme